MFIKILTQETNTFHMPNAYVLKSLRVNESLKQDKTIDFNVTEYDKFYHFYFASTSLVPNLRSGILLVQKM